MISTENVAASNFWWHEEYYIGNSFMIPSEMLFGLNCCRFACTAHGARGSGTTFFLPGWLRAAADRESVADEQSCVVVEITCDPRARLIDNGSN